MLARRISARETLIATFLLSLLPWKTNILVEKRFLPRDFNQRETASLDENEQRIKNQIQAAVATTRNATREEGGGEIFDLKNNESQNKSRLAFVHIPKNAGSSIEKIANRDGIEWGLYSNAFCGPLHDNAKAGQWWGKCVKRIQNETCPPWHYPEKLSSLYDDNDKITTFCVIRNPFERFLSIFKYNNGRGRSDCSADAFNKWAHRIMLQRETKKYSMHCHLLQQTSFPCDRILLFENLGAEFDNLMKEFGLNLTLSNNKKNVHERSSDSCRNLTASDLTPEVHDLVSTYYAEDLSLHGKLVRERSIEATAR